MYNKEYNRDAKANNDSINDFSLIITKALQSRYKGTTKAPQTIHKTLEYSNLQTIYKKIRGSENNLKNVFLISFLIILLQQNYGGNAC